MRRQKMRKYDPNLENHNVMIKAKVDLYTKSKIQKNKQTNRGKLFKTWKIVQCDGQ